ncbi:hypothetical protein ALC62_01843 [Cyphomyrmex costatus]|uniref:Uncharacterized protein n=1 Tax=Cyphomyrmex costatus TaxID=456900 RepID=A0A151INX5_9HYME|nr:hypothetical protein ALC62_01843 [Cyphomyrmex costatus]
MRSLLLIAALSAIFLRESFSKPMEKIDNSDVLDPVASIVNEFSENDTTREQRSPQFGLLGGYNDYDYNDYDDAYYFRYGNKRKYHHYKPFRPHRPHGLIGGYGCRGGYGCGGGYGGWQPDYGGHHHGQGASFASASAGSVSGGGPYGGGHSEANSQSASFNIGPFSASFSTAQSSGQTGF